MQASDADAQGRFDRECRAIGALSWHPNIVVVHDSGVTADGRLYLAMEYLEQGSLADEVLRSGARPWAEVVRAGVEVSLASTLYTLLAGRAAFARETDESIAATVLRAVTEPAPDLRPLGVPDDLAVSIEAAMVKDPNERPATAEAFGRSLQGVQQAHGLPVTDMRLDPRRATAGDDTILTGAVPLIPVPGGDNGGGTGDGEETVVGGDLPPVPGTAQVAAPESADDAAAARRRRRLLLIGALVLILVLGAGVS